MRDKERGDERLTGKKNKCPNRGIERWVNPQGSGELESYSCWIHHLLDRKRANKVWNQLMRFDPQRKILS